MSQITVYLSNFCPQCRGAKMLLNSKGIEFEERNVDENEDYKSEMAEYGFRALPLIIADSTSVEPFTGFDTTKLTQIAAELSEAVG